MDETEEACDPEDEDCTVVGENDVVTETWVATPEQDGTSNGFTGHCNEGGSCTHEIDYDDANAAQDVLLEAHFEPEPPPQEVTYTHNYLGQMASMTVNGNTTYYVYDEQGRPLSEINEDGVSIKDYIYAEDQLVAWVEKSGDVTDEETLEQVFYPFNNHLGQPFMTVRADVMLGHEQYTDPFGKVQAMYIDKSLGVDEVGPLPLIDGLPGQRLQPSGYYDNWYRTYEGGRYLQPDPIGLRGGINPYVYVNNNPVMFVDPWGLALVKYNYTDGSGATRTKVKDDGNGTSSKDMAENWLRNNAPNALPGTCQWVPPSGSYEKCDCPIDADKKAEEDAKAKQAAAEQAIEDAERRKNAAENGVSPPVTEDPTPSAPAPERNPNTQKGIERQIDHDTGYKRD